MVTNSLGCIILRSSGFNLIAAIVVIATGFIYIILKFIPGVEHPKGMILLVLYRVSE